MKVAIFVDGGFYRRRSQSVMGDITAEERANELSEYCHRHLHKSREKDNCRDVEFSLNRAYA